jgi:hypothetical protein
MKTGWGICFLESWELETGRAFAVRHNKRKDAIGEMFKLDFESSDGPLFGRFRYGWCR